MKYTWLIVWTAAGCAGGGDPADPQSTPGLPEDEPPSDYIFDEEAPPEPTATVAEIGEALQEALDVTMTVHAAPVQTAYDAAMSGSTGACPYVYVTPDGAYWYDSCTSSMGTEFDGYVFAYGQNGLYDPYSGFTFDYWYAFGGATVQDPQGHQLELAGTAVWQSGHADAGGFEVWYYYTDVGGTFSWDGPEARGTWLDTDIDPDLIVSTTSVPIADASSSVLYGGFGGFADGWAIAYDENVIGSELLELPCERELSGTIGLRAPDGTWYDVQFDGSDGSDAATYDKTQCDGCGQAYYQGEPMGEVCADFSVLITMGVQPW